MNHLQIAKDYLITVEKNEEDWLISEAAAVTQAHALIAIAEQLEKANDREDKIRANIQQGIEEARAERDKRQEGK